MPLLRNLTPHTVRIVVAPDTPSVELPADGIVPRCEIRRHQVGNVVIEGVDVPVAESVVEGGVTRLPDEQAGVMLIVSRLVADARPDRRDLLFPDQGVRAADGTVIACRSLARVSRSSE